MFYIIIYKQKTTVLIFTFIINKNDRQGITCELGILIIIHTPR